ncbi:MAG: alginate export family protein [Planctomycetota bacterium]|nr:alginate export family protein [Planctomycetota bacterium]
MKSVLSTAPRKFLTHCLGLLARFFVASRSQIFVPICSLGAPRSGSKSPAHWASYFCGAVLSALALAACLGLGRLAAEEKTYTDKVDLPSSPFSEAATAVKQRPLGGGWTFTLGGSTQLRAQALDNRRDFDFGGNDEDFSLLERTRLNAAFAKDDLFKVFVEAQDAHEFWRDRLPGTNPNEDALDLYQGYLEFSLLKDIADMPALRIRLGRQELFYGTEVLFGDRDWFNTGQSFDLARVTWRPEAFEIDFFAGRPVAFDHRNPDAPAPHTNLAGANLKFLDAPARHRMEAYAYYRGDEETRFNSEHNGHGPEHLGTLGGLASAPFFGRWDYRVEAMGQFGSRGGDPVRAWLGTAELGYTFPLGWRRVRLAVKQTLASGDRSPVDGVQETFDILFGDPFEHTGKLLAVDGRNLNQFAAKLEARVWQGGLVAVDFHRFRLFQERDALYQGANGMPLRRDATGRAGGWAGHELDVQITHRFNENVSLSGGGFFFMPGRLFEKSGNGGHDASRNLFLMLRLSF